MISNKVFAMSLKKIIQVKLYITRSLSIQKLIIKLKVKIKYLITMKNQQFPRNSIQLILGMQINLQMQALI